MCDVANVRNRASATFTGSAKATQLTMEPSRSVEFVTTERHCIDLHDENQDRVENGSNRSASSSERVQDRRRKLKKQLVNLQLTA